MSKTNLFVLPLTLFAIFVPPVLAAKYTVNNTNDSGPGSLREAIATANSTADSDVIVFNILGRIVLTSGELVISPGNSAGTLTISNPSGPGNLIISGNNASRIFYADTGSNLTLDGLTMENGFAAEGSAIKSRGTLNVLNSMLRSNTESSPGGGTAIEQFGYSLLISRSEITDNPSGYSGGSVYALESKVTIRDSTIANNGAGGLYLDGYSTTPVAIVSNTTFSNNSAPGAITMDQGIAYVTNSTITLNWAGVNAGWNGGTVFVRNNIISGNTLDFRQNYLYVSDLGNNLIGGSANLGPLTNNGGPTRTHALLAGSPAINAGNDCVLTYKGCGDGNPALPNDQRGKPRNGTVDIGAFERQTSETSSRAPFDFDGDGRSDVSVFRPSDSVWYLNRSTDGFRVVRFGLSTDKIVPADYDGDGKTDIAIYRDGDWWWIDSSTGAVHSVHFGIASDIPVPADYTGDGRDELAVYRSGQWWTLDLSNGQASVVNFGLSTDKPVPADYDGDGKIDQAIYRNGEWHLNRSSQGYTVAQFGIATDKPGAGDYDGDGKADLAVYRDGTWYLLQSRDGFGSIAFGIASDVPAPADYDGDRRTDVAVFRPSTGVWYRLYSSSGSYSADRFGLAGDIPAAGFYIP